MKEMAILFALAIVSEVSSADSDWNPNEYNAGFAEGLCEIHEFTECLNISKEQCLEMLLEAANSCPSRSKKAKNIDFPDPVCTTNVFIEKLGLPDKQVQKCDEKLDELLQKNAQ